MANKSLWILILTVFLAINALFWGLFPHSMHCSLLSSIGIKQCPSHIIHIVIGILFFLAAIYVRQGNFINPKNWD